MNIVADTNVIVSAFFWRKSLQSISDLINDRKITICFSPKTIEELYLVIKYPHIAKKTEQDNINSVDLIDKLVSNSIIVYPEFTTSAITDHPIDNIFLTCALESNADSIVSGDQHLLKLKTFHNISILTPRQFLNHFRKAK